MVLSTEDDGLVVVGQYLALNVLANRSREHNLLKVFSFQHQTFGGVFVRDAGDVLFYDGACV